VSRPALPIFAPRAQNCNLIIEALVIGDLDLPIEPLEELPQAFAAEESDIGALSGKDKKIARELDRIAVSLLVKNGDAATVRIVPLPLRDLMVERILRHSGKDPAIFVKFEASLEILAK
jgi:hypothetical protein